MSVKMEDLVSLCKRRGFIYQGSDVYGGLSGTWDYGPLGVALKRNIMNLWWQHFVDSRDDMYGVDAAILMNQKVWQASGHVDTFSDPLVECGNCKGRFRADKMVDGDKFSQFIARQEETLEELEKEDQSPLSEEVAKFRENGIVDYERMRRDNLPLYETIYKIETRPHDVASLGVEIHELKNYSGNLFREYLNLENACEVCGSKDWGPSRPFNMMFKTHVGATEGADNISYLRPETAQGIFTNFKNVVDTFYPDLPFGIAQQGKAFRNEIAPRDFVFRSREFEQMEIEYFVDPSDWETEFEKWRQHMHQWFELLGLPAEKVHELEVPEADRAHYSRRTVDFEFDYPIGCEEMAGLAYRTDFDLGNLQRASGKSMEYTVKGTNTKFVPHVIEPTFGVERALMAVLSEAYTEDEVDGQKRVYLRLPGHLAPVKFAVSPLLKNKPELLEKAREIYRSLKQKHGRVMWDDNGNIGKRYRRQDEIGTPHCVVIDFQTLEDGTVTVRERDTMEQKRVEISGLY